MGWHSKMVGDPQSIPFLRLRCRTSNSDRCTMVGNTERKLIDGGSFVLSGQTELISGSVHGNVFRVLGSELVDGLLNVFESAFVAHLFGGNVRVHTGTVPVTLDDWLWEQRAVDLKVFAYSLEDVTRHHELIAGVDSDARSDLVFLLSGHDFSVGSGNGDTGIETCLVHGVGDGTSKAVFWSNTAVVWTLWAVWHTSLWPSERSLRVKVERSEFLFESEPWFHVFESLECFHGCVSRKKTTCVSMILLQATNIKDNND
mmetsp:Transcript_33348/g.51079  ORF Transcript_33348/g.51079 Transcript_33348/m.51079 type:complete len:258 (+) Transcript_33348:183-956(+)